MEGGSLFHKLNIRNKVTNERVFGFYNRRVTERSAQSVGWQAGGRPPAGCMV